MITFKPAFLIFYGAVWLGCGSCGQSKFDRDDMLRGSITPARTWWDLKHYDLNVIAHPGSKTLEGRVIVTYEVIFPDQTIQIDLQPPLKIIKVIQDGQTLNYTKDGKNAYMILLTKPQQPIHRESIIVYYQGKPIEANDPPWQGGVQWTTDKEGNPFIATSCQGLGASAWWPCKDHMYDEPDSMTISVTVPEKLMDVSNGRLREVISNQDGTKTFTWSVRNPINNYGVNMNIGNYVHFSDTLHGEAGVIDMDYYVLPYNLDKAGKQFKQAKLMMRAFEHWFGPFPFYADGYKLVEVPYLGMEHQSSVTYGNGYKNGYLGRDLSKTGWGLKWDFIIIHESAHEWFGNNITYNDIADKWIHESFANYSESLYTEYYYGKKAGSEYVIGTRRAIRNNRPIIGDYRVNNEGSGDMYTKGGNMLHTIRQIIDDDQRWREILQGLNKIFHHQTVESNQIEQYLSKESGKDLSKVFDQYLRDTRIPILEYTLSNDSLKYRWNQVVTGFDMPVRIRPGKTEQYKTLHPTTSWKSEPVKTESILVDPDFYVEARRLN